jgi:hypothetical protein
VTSATPVATWRSRASLRSATAVFASCSRVTRSASPANARSRSASLTLASALLCSLTVAAACSCVGLRIVGSRVTGRVVPGLRSSACWTFRVARFLCVTSGALTDVSANTPVFFGANTPTGAFDAGLRFAFGFGLREGAAVARSASI